jgi:hypothetical protein
MSRNCVMLIGVLLTGTAEMSQASPLDAPDIVYVDGLPCNSLCQSYMVWSREATSPRAERMTSTPAPLPPRAAGRHMAVTSAARAKPAARANIAKQIVPTPGERPRTRIAATPPAISAAAGSTPARTADVQPAAKATADSAPVKTPEMQPAAKAAAASVPAKALASSPAADTTARSDSPATRTADLQPGPAAMDSGSAPIAMADPHPPGDPPAGSGIRSSQQQVAAATEVAEQITAAALVAAPVPTAKPSGDQPDTTASVDPGKAATAANVDALVAVLLTRADIKSVSELTGKNIAIDDRHSASEGNVRTAIAAAGATEAQLSDGQAKAIDRLTGGEVPAAVVTLVSAEAAEGFPDIEGFRVFRIPLSPRSMKAGTP